MTRTIAERLGEHYRRGAGGRRRGRDRDQVEAEVFRDIGTLSPVTGACTEDQTCTYQPARRGRDGDRRGGDRRDDGRCDGGRRDGDRRDGGRCDGDRRDGDRGDSDRRDGGRRDDDRRDGGRRDGDNDNGEPRIAPVPVPVPALPGSPNEVAWAIERIQSMAPQMHRTAQDLVVQCARWCDWMMWINLNCPGRQWNQGYCFDARNYLRDVTDMQNDLQVIYKLLNLSKGC